MSQVPTIGSVLHVRFAKDPPQTPAIRGFVITAHDRNLVAELRGMVSCRTGDSAEIQYAIDQARWVINAVVQLRLSGERHPMVRFMLQGEPAFAERRGCVRVSTAAADLRAAVGRTIGCPVVNISAEGLAVVTPLPFEVGEVVPVTLADPDGKYISGHARVAHAYERPDGRTRCGLQVEPGQRNLLHGLQRLVTSTQRQQLRRLTCWR